jgi:hypothetical protein
MLLLDLNLCIGVSRLMRFGFEGLYDCSASRGLVCRYVSSHDARVEGSHELFKSKAVINSIEQ